MKAVDDATKRQRLLLQRQETERRVMGREEERMKRCDELTRRLIEKPHRNFQEKGHRLYHHTIARSTFAPATVRRMQWVRAWTHTGQHDSLTAQCRDPADGKMLLFRSLVCGYDEDIKYVMEQVEEFEDIHHHNVMRIISASAFSTPIVNASSGQRGGMQKSVAMVCTFCPGGQLADRCLYDSYPQVENDTMLQWARDVAAALRAMHMAGVTHRNLNPRNVHLDAKGRAVVTGFQILKMPRAPGDPYSFGRTDCGTPAIIAPEVEDGHPVTPAADIWAFGCCLFAWTSAQPELPQGIMRDLSMDRILRQVPKRFGAKLRSAIRMCLQHHPGHRASADELWRMLSTSRK